MMVFDGQCGFCKYWVIRWKKMSADKIDFQPYQKVSSSFQDIEQKHFKEAVRYIDLNGKIYSGPAAAYYTYYIRDKVKFLFLWYENKTWFRKQNDLIYQWIADNRSFVFEVCIKMLGKNPRETKHYWLIYLLAVIAIISLISFWIAST